MFSDLFRPEKTGQAQQHTSKQQGGGAAQRDSVVVFRLRAAPFSRRWDAGCAARQRWALFYWHYDPVRVYDAGSHRKVCHAGGERARILRWAIAQSTQMLWRVRVAREAGNA